MNSYRTIITRLLLGTASSRAVLQLASGAGFRIAAEVVQHGASQLGQDDAEALVHGPDCLANLARERHIRHEDGVSGGPGAQVVAPVVVDGHLAAILTLQQAPEPRSWTGDDLEALERARGEIGARLAEESGGERTASVDLRTPAAQAILDRLRDGMNSQRCTFRQPVEAAYQFPVTFESRASGVRPLLGDFSIVQTGQPVIVQLLANRAQVVQNDCSVASSEPKFHTMLAHYGGMRAQIVTPFIVGDELRGVLSVHELRHTRTWTEAERSLAADAARLIGGLFETSR